MFRKHSKHFKDKEDHNKMGAVGSAMICKHCKQEKCNVEITYQKPDSFGNELSDWKNLDKITGISFGLSGFKPGRKGPVFFTKMCLPCYKKMKEDGPLDIPDIYKPEVEILKEGNYYLQK